MFNNHLNPLHSPRRIGLSLGSLILMMTLLAWAMLAPIAAADPLVTVTDTGDSGAGTLRQALLDVDDGGTITFDAALSGQQITLAGTQLLITKSVTISASVPISVSANNQSRVFRIENNANVTIDGLTIRDGNLLVFDDCGGFNAKCGGGIYIDTGSAVTVNNSTLSGNSASNGGGIYSIFGTMTVSNSTLSDNSATDDGGGIFSRISTVTVNNSTLSDNSANLGGGIFSRISTVTVSNSTLSGNSANFHGGGIYNGSIMTVNNSTFSGNSANFHGGGIYNGSIMTVNNSTLSGNSASRGGGIENHLFITINNTIIASELSAPPNNCATFGTITAGSDTLATDGTCGDATVIADPLLAPLADNGSSVLAGNPPTVVQTHALLPGSPAIDAGNNATCETTDPRGIARPQGAACDIGSFEFVNPDSDGDGIFDINDNCVTVPNPGQENNDGDNEGDACDTDDDNDGIADNDDNCVIVPNPGQENNDGDNEGDACDTDDDNDGIADDVDAFPFSDLSPTTVVDGCDSGVLNQLLPNGATFNDLIAAALEDASNHGQFVKAVSKLTNEWKKDGLISGSDKGSIMACA